MRRVALALLALWACGDGDGATAPVTPVPTAPPNRSPEVVGAIPAVTLAVGDTVGVDVAEYFHDPDGDALSYSVAISDAEVATASVSGSEVTVTRVAAGEAAVTVTASDPGSLSAAQSFAVTVTNRSPEAVGAIPAVTLAAGDTVGVDVAEYFHDPDGDALSYAAAISDAEVATASVSGSEVTVTRVAAGEAAVTVTASDPGGLSATQGFAVSAPPQRGYPIHVNFLGEFPYDLRKGVEDAVAIWSNILSPTGVAPFTFDQDLPVNFTISDSLTAWGLPRGTFKPGQTLEGGLHLYVAERRSTRYYGYSGRAEVRELGTSAVITTPIGLLALSTYGINSAYTHCGVIFSWSPPCGDRDKFVRSVVLHELGHIFGIGRSQRWRDSTKKKFFTPAHHDSLYFDYYYFADSAAIEVFDKMGGVSLAETTRKIPLTVDANHWGWCSGLSHDVMGRIAATGREFSEAKENQVVTELTMASLAQGYTYDPNMIPPQSVLNSTEWNHDGVRGIIGPCRDGVN